MLRRFPFKLEIFLHTVFLHLCIVLWLSLMSHDCNPPPQKKSGTHVGRFSAKGAGKLFWGPCGRG